MTRGKCSIRGCGLAAAGLLLWSLAGCATGPAVTVLPNGAELPRGFHPLKQHADAGDACGSYNGWPRFIFSEQDKMVMVYVPSQTITMGGGLQPNEVPARQVKINHFYIDLHEVTNVQFDCFTRTARSYDVKCTTGRCGDDECETSSSCGSSGGCGSCGGGCPFLNLCGGKSCCDRRGSGLWTEVSPCYPWQCFDVWDVRKQKPGQICRFRDYWVPGVNDAHPARSVSWREAWYYSNWSCKELPSEAQWEAAARGDDARVYPWGNQEESDVTRYLCNSRTGRGNYDGYEYTAPVLSFAAGVSPYGAFNMSGNVWEWCGDWYDPGRYAYPSSEDPATGVQRGPRPFGDRNYPNPWDKDTPEARVGPMRGADRALRGGSYADPIQRCRVDSRWHGEPDAHMVNVGFRTVLPLPPES